MDRNQKSTQNRATAQNALAAAQLTALETEKRRTRAMVCAWGSVTAMALVATLGLAEGCAHDHTRVSDVSNSSATEQAVVASTDGLSTGASSPLAPSSSSSSFPSGRTTFTRSRIRGVRIVLGA